MTLPDTAPILALAAHCARRGLRRRAARALYDAIYPKEHDNGR